VTAPLVSILIPCHNAARYVAAAVEAALAQTWPHVEVVVVNDGSTDESAQVLSPFERRGVKVIHQENRGQCAAANAAFRASSGAYVKFLDADDLINPEAVERQMQRLQGSQAAVASCEWCRFYGDDVNHVDLRPETVWRDMEATDWLVESWKDAEPMMQCGIWLIPRALLDRSGLWDERLSLINDFEFFARVLCHATEVRFTPRARLFYRSGHAGVLSARRDRPAVESAFLSICAGTGHLLARRSDAAARAACANILQSFIYSNYPGHRDLRAAVERRIAELGGSTLRPRWPPRFEALRRVAGWKLARRLQRWFAG